METTRPLSRNLILTIAIGILLMVIAQPATRWILPLAMGQAKRLRHRLPRHLCRGGSVPAAWHTCLWLGGSIPRPRPDE